MRITEQIRSREIGPAPKASYPCLDPINIFDACVVARLLSQIYSGNKKPPKTGFSFSGADFAGRTYITFRFKHLGEVTLEIVNYYYEVLVDNCMVP
jgi:hypothetical protein